METISIRNLRGERLREEAGKGKLLAITNRGGLIGVVVPVAAAWLEHLISYNLSQVQQSIGEAEQHMADETPMVTIGEVVGQLQGMLNPDQQQPESSRPSTRTVRIGDLSAKEIEQAGVDGQTIAVTHDRELIAIIIPVTRNLVEFLLEQNMSRVLHNIEQDRREIRSTRPLTSVDLVAGRQPRDDKPAPAPKRDPARRR
jgi:antitoxin (DNA-binding transcriptional repressor) of toxin-antitoxin stability system